MPQTVEDPLRARLIAAALRVFAAKGFDGARILDIVREAGLSTGAVYGRFQSKTDLLREAVVHGSRHGRSDIPGLRRVADLISQGGQMTTGPLTDEEAVRLEAFVAARRDPEVAASLGEAQATFRRRAQPLVDAAIADGTVAPDLDPEAVLYLVRTIQLGLLLQRGAATQAPDPVAWRSLIQRIVSSFGDPEAAPLEAVATHPDTHRDTRTGASRHDHDGTARQG
jgi:AcrR family transcriptional regulator